MLALLLWSQPALHHQRANSEGFNTTFTIISYIKDLQRHSDHVEKIKADLRHEACVASKATMSASSSRMNCYEVLGIAQDADLKEINSAYKRLALQYHPDKTGGDNVSVDEFRKVRFPQLLP